MQLRLQHLPDQRVVPVRTGSFVQCRHEHVPAEHQLEEVPGCRPIDSRAGRHRQFVQDGSGQHEVGYVWALPVEDLVEEIAGHRVPVQLDPAGGVAGVGRALHRERSHLQPRRPSLTAFLDEIQVAAAE